MSAQAWSVSGWFFAGAIRATTAEARVHPGGVPAGESAHAGARRDEEPVDQGHPFEVVFVCTGNRARSPLGEAFLKMLVGPDVVVRSVGILDVGSEPALPQALRAARHFGVDLTAHRARFLESGELGRADLVLGFEPTHVSMAIVEGCARRERTFSLPELTEILDQLAFDAASSLTREGLLGLANEQRPTGFLQAPVIPDPLGGSDDVFLATADEIQRHVRYIAEVLFPR